MPKFRGGIPKPAGAPSAADSRNEAAAWIAGAPGKATYPWQAPHVRTDLHVQVNTKQPEKLMLQVDWLADQLEMPKRALIEEALRRFVAEEFRIRSLEP